MNPNPSQMSPGDQQLMIMLTEMQMQDSIGLYNKLVSRAFKACVRDFRDSTLSKKEDKCVNVVAEKFLRSSQRTGARFAEHQARQGMGMPQADAAAVAAANAGVPGAGAGAGAGIGK